MRAGLVTKKLRIMTAGLLGLALISPKDNPNNIIYDNPIDETYDFIVVGGGTAGSVLSARLSEDPTSHVLLLEAGEAGTAYTEWPALTKLVYDTKKWDWRFLNVRDEGYCVGMKGQACKLSRGKMLGGQSAFNRMMYVRGNRNDYDLWEKLGNPGWGYGDVLPYFIRSEDNHDYRLRHSPYHGVGGPLKVSSPKRHQLSDLAPLWLKAAVHNGFEIGDINGDRQARFMLHQTTTAHGERWSTARGFLAPASHRHNLNVIVESQVTRIIIDPHTNRAKGVVFFKDKKRRVAWARKEVILSAGTFNSPQLLKLSGIGPCAELKKHGIFCKKDLPGVGENLQSHFGIGGIDFLVNQGGFKGLSKSLKNPVYKAKYVKNRIGPLATVMNLEGTGFFSTTYNNVSYGEDWPDCQLLFFPQQIASDGIYDSIIYGLSYKLWLTYAPNKYKPGYRIVPVNLRPRSRGRVALRSRNPWQHPDIFLNLFDDPHDLAVLREAGRMAEQVGLSEPFLRVGAHINTEKNRFCHLHPTGGPDWWDCRARVFPETVYQETSTCKMGPPHDPYAVVDNQLRVYGVSGLRVVDASIMPTIVSGDGTAATVMIAERAADMIRAFWHGLHLGADPVTFVEETVMRTADRRATGVGPVVVQEQMAGTETATESIQKAEEAAVTQASQMAQMAEIAEIAQISESVTEPEMPQMPEMAPMPEMPQMLETVPMYEIPEMPGIAQEVEVTEGEAPQKSYTVQMGEMNPMSGTIVVEEVKMTAEKKTAGAEDGAGSRMNLEAYDGYGDYGDRDYGGFSETELFGDFDGLPDAEPGNFGGFLEPTSDFDGYPEPEPAAGEDYGAPLGLEPMGDYGAPLGPDPTSDYGTPLGPDPTSDYGAPLGPGPTPDYGAPVGPGPTSDYGAPLGPDPMSDYGGFGDYSELATATVSSGPSPTSVEEGDETSRPGAGRLEANIRRLKEEMMRIKSASVPGVVVTERNVPRFNGRGGTTGEPRTYTSVYTGGLGDGMEGIFDGNKKREVAGGSKKREVVDEFVAAASVDHASVFQKMQTEKHGGKSEVLVTEDPSRASHTTVKQDGRGQVEARRKVIEARSKTAVAASRNVESQSSTRLKVGEEAEAKRTILQARRKVAVAVERNSGYRSRHRADGVEEVEPERTKIWARGNRPTSANTEVKSQKRQRKNAAVAVESKRTVIQKSRSPPVAITSNASSRHPQSTVRSRLFQTEVAQSDMVTFGSKRQRIARPAENSADDVVVGSGRKSSKYAKSWAEDGGGDDDTDALAEVNDDIAVFEPSMWGMKN